MRRDRQQEREARASTTRSAWGGRGCRVSSRPRAARRVRRPAATPESSTARRARPTECACAGTVHASPGPAAGTARSALVVEELLHPEQPPLELLGAFSSGARGRSCCSAAWAALDQLHERALPARASNEDQRVAGGSPIAAARRIVLHRHDRLDRPTHRGSKVQPRTIATRVDAPDAPLARDVPDRLAGQRVERHDPAVVLHRQPAQRLDVGGRGQGRARAAPRPGAAASRARRAAVAAGCERRGAARGCG